MFFFYANGIKTKLYFIFEIIYIITLQCYLQDIDLELAALEEGNRNRQAELSAYAELDNVADEDEQEPPGWSQSELHQEKWINMIKTK